MCWSEETAKSYRRMHGSSGVNAKVRTFVYILGRCLILMYFIHTSHYHLLIGENQCLLHCHMNNFLIVNQMLFFFPFWNFLGTYWTSYSKADISESICFFNPIWGVRLSFFRLNFKVITFHSKANRRWYAFLFSVHLTLALQRHIASLKLLCHIIWTE